ncbi:MAG: helix-turn-helix transcriptional regulator, partial [Lachnospiraceae bacterium]|nr:helix-turn-helix transcriptional regulator [Lachnospiraceae bacterium]
DCLTENEWKLARLAASRLSNREIAAEMGFSEGTVKQYLNRIYGKLHLEGDSRNKRLLLEKLFSVQ